MSGKVDAFEAEATNIVDRSCTEGEWRTREEPRACEKVGTIVTHAHTSFIRRGSKVVPMWQAQTLFGTSWNFISPGWLNVWTEALEVEKPNYQTIPLKAV